jgi:hypothetical protein
LKEKQINVTFEGEETQEFFGILHPPPGEAPADPRVFAPEKRKSQKSEISA